MINDKQEKDDLRQVAKQQRQLQQRNNARNNVKSIGKVVNENEIYGFTGHDNKLRFRIPDAREWLVRGLKYYLGNRAVWLNEYDEVVAWMEHNEGKGLLCLGDCGRGKTLITQKILPAVFELSLHLHFQCYRAIDLLERYEEIANNRVIFLDDVGTEPNAKIYGVTRDLFSELVDLCERQDKLLICSTNLSRLEIVGGKDENPKSPTYGEVFEGRYGLRTFDRLRSITKRVRFIGDSFRNK